MIDTQWPRFEVFVQEQENEPHQHAGSVHAPDAEIALLNARDVFVRRPQCLSLWVVPAEKVLIRTAQELENQAWLNLATAEQGTEEPYCVFQKLEQKGTLNFVGLVQASSALQALGRALHGEASGPLMCAVFAAACIGRSSPEDAESLFEPALHKPYKDQSYYQTVQRMYEIKKARTGRASD